MKIESLQIETDFGFSLTCEAFSMNRGEVTILSARSGEGKTTFINSLLGLLPKQFNVSGRLLFDNSQYDVSRITFFPPEVAYAIQGKHVLHPLKKVKNQIFGSKVDSFLQKQAEDNISKLMNYFGFFKIKEILNAYPYELSGGQKQLFVIALAVFEKKELIILDEPTLGLDESKIEILVDYLVKLKQESKSKILIVSHDVSFAERIGDFYYSILNNKVTSTTHKKKVLNKENTIDSQPQSEVLFFLKNMQFQYKKPTFLFKKATFSIGCRSLSLNKGEIIGFKGPTGSGKTTLTNILIGKISIKKGVYQKNFTSIQKIFQDSYSSFDELLSIIENLELYDCSKFEIEAVFNKFGFQLEDLNKRINEFSGGESQKLAFARAILLKSEVLICDEPFINLDDFQKIEIIKYLKDLVVKYNIGIIVISHNLITLKQLCHQLYYFNLTKNNHCNVEVI